MFEEADEADNTGPEDPPDTAAQESVTNYERRGDVSCKPLEKCATKTPVTKKLDARGGVGSEKMLRGTTNPIPQVVQDPAQEGGQRHGEGPQAEQGDLHSTTYSRI